ncbi:MAG: hypothetical protein HZB09_01585 [Candidatus Yonathbacteria bacterium]|nr:hypothetical protein [Candidatus Yonathbacteria bacterium]
MTIGFFNELAFLLFSIAIAGGVYVAQDIKIRTTEEKLVQQASLASQRAIEIAEKRTQAKMHCMDLGIENFSCYETYYKDLVGKYGVRSAFDDLKARYTASNFIKAQCHQLSHTIGHATADLYRAPSEAFSHGDSFCWSGYYHGVMETIVEKIGKEAIPTALDTICNDIPNKRGYSFDYYNCVHGLGHGITTLLSGELFDSLAMCDQLSGEWEKSTCSGGVFMENIMSETRTGVSKYLKNDDLLYPCNAVSDAHKPQCFLMQSSHMLAVTDYDWKRVFTVCASAPAQYRNLCYQSIGRDASGSTVSDIEKTKNICNLATTKEQKEGCIAGAARDFVSYFHSDVQAKKMCNVFDVEFKSTCRSVVSSYYKTF